MPSILTSATAFGFVGACLLLGSLPAAELYSENFDAGNGGLSASGANSSWQHGEPTTGPGGAHSGTSCWATGLGGNYADDENSALSSPVIDLSTHGGDLLILYWFQSVVTEERFDVASVEISTNGGGSWQRVYGEISGGVAPGWSEAFVVLDAAAAVAGFRYRFSLRSDGSDTAAGCYIDSVRIVSVPRELAYGEDFELGGGGFSGAGVGSSWEHGSPTSGPGAAHSGNAAWGTNLDGFYTASEDSTLVSPTIDLSSHTGKSFVLSWLQHIKTEGGFDHARVDIRADAGSAWSTVYGRVSGLVSEFWTRKAVILGSEFATSTLQVRFGLQADGFFQDSGLYIDDVKIHVVESGLLEPVSGYANWLPFPSGTPAALLAPDADFDLDQLSNFFEYAFVTDATSGVALGSPTIVEINDGGVIYAGLEFSVRSDDPQISYELGASLDLANWSSIALSFDGFDWTLAAGGLVVVSTAETSPGVWQLRVRQIVSRSSQPRQFLRVSAHQ
jgi:hypothetical protein